MELAESADSWETLGSATAHHPCLLGLTDLELGRSSLRSSLCAAHSPNGRRQGTDPGLSRCCGMLRAFPLQDRFHSQRLPAWASHLAADGGAAFCTALARGCALDASVDAAAAAAVTATATANGTRLTATAAAAAAAAALALSQPHRCARCLPPVDGRNAAAAAATRAVSAGGRCDGGGGKPAC